jgi:flagellar biosynthesis protein FlhB
VPEDLGEKTEAPTSRRLEEAREKGQVAKSQDLAGAVDLLAAVILLAVFGGVVARSMTSILRRVLQDWRGWGSMAEVGGLIRGVAADAAIALAPIMGIMVVVVILAHVVQTGPLLTTRPLQPNLSRLNPLAGLKRLVERRNMVKSMVQIAKIAVAAVVGWLFVSGAAAQIVALPRLGLAAGAAAIGQMLFHLALWLVALLIVLGLADLLFQRWQHTQDLRMTKDEVKDERRSMEGDPEIKSRRARMARQIAMQRIGQAVPTADVVVTNPTHFAVAIRYDQDAMHAPRIVAKGADLLALRIRQVAAASGVPIVERPPLARALYAGFAVGQDVSPEFYQAVAEVLAYVYRLDRQAVA